MPPVPRWGFWTFWTASPCARVSSPGSENEVGSWRPTEGGQLLADGLARSQWGGPVFRAALREVADDVRGGRLGLVRAIMLLVRVRVCPGRA